MALTIGRNPYRPQEPFPTPTKPGQGGMFESSRPPTGTYYGGVSDPTPPAPLSRPSATQPGAGASVGTQAGTQGSPYGPRTSYPGGGPIGQGALERQEQTRLEAQLRREESERRQKSFQALLSQFSGALPARISHPGIAPGSDEAGARAAAFARAKETAGMNAQAAMTALQGLGEEQGLMGSTMVARQAGQAVGGARADINDFLREQLGQDLGRAQQVADLGYQGAITQRGQDINRRQALLGLMAAGGLY